MSYSEQYIKVNGGRGWQNENESHDTPLEADNLNHMDNGIKVNDIRITQLENESMGIQDSDTIGWEVVGTKRVGNIKPNSITDDMIEYNYLTKVKNEADRSNEGVTVAVESANASKSWAVGGTGTREGEDTNNAKYWSEQARIGVTGNYVSYDEQTLTEAQKAQARANIGAIEGDDFVTEEEVQTMLDGKSDVGHNHDSRYYTKTEIGNMLGTQVTFSLNGTTLNILTK